MLGAETPVDWIQAQDELKKKLVTEDTVKWELHTRRIEIAENNNKRKLKYVGGVDLSFSKHYPSFACGSLVVLDLNTLELVYEDSTPVRLTVPYVPGFLAFREAPVLLEMLEKMKACSHPFYPQMLLVDGNGILHPRGFGLACHLGVLANIPTIGIGKNEVPVLASEKKQLDCKELHHVDGLTQSRVKELLANNGNCGEHVIPLVGDSGRTWGAALQSTQGSIKPIFISVGHCVSLDTAIEIVKISCKYRVPEPIRQADIKSGEFLRKNPELFKTM